MQISTECSFNGAVSRAAAFFVSSAVLLLAWAVGPFVSPSWRGPNSLLLGSFMLLIASVSACFSAWRLQRRGVAEKAAEVLSYTPRAVIRTGPDGVIVKRLEIVLSDGRVFVLDDKLKEEPLTCL